MLAAQDYAFVRWVISAEKSADDLNVIANAVRTIVTNYGSLGQLDSVLKQYRFARLFMPAAEQRKIDALIET